MFYKIYRFFYWFWNLRTPELNKELNRVTKAIRKADIRLDEVESDEDFFKYLNIYEKLVYYECLIMDYCGFDDIEILNSKHSKLVDEVLDENW